MRVAVSDIKVKKRIRKENGDIESLMESLQAHGLMNPVVISEKYELIAGFRRLSAAKKLGWDTIPATMVNAKAKVTRLELELEENIQRLDFTDDEILEGLAALDRYKNPRGFRKLVRLIVNFFTNFFDRIEAQKVEKRRKSAVFSLLAPLAIIFMILSAYWHKNEFISSILLSIFNIIAVVVLVIGIFFFIRFLIGIKKNNLI